MTKWDLFQEYKDGFTLGSPLMWLTTLKWEKSDGYFMDAKKTSDRITCVIITYTGEKRNTRCEISIWKKL